MRHPVVVRVRPAALLGEWADGRRSWGEERPCAGPDQVAERLAELLRLAGAAGATGAVQVRISPELLQHRVLDDLPPVDRQSLRQLVARGRTRYFREDGQPLVTDAVWETHADEPGQFARAVALERRVAESLVSGASAVGATLLDIVPEDCPAGLSLLPEAERTLRERRTRRGLLHLAVGVALLWLLSLVGALGYLRWRAERSRAEITRLAAPRRALIEARHKIHEADLMVRAIERHADRRFDLVWRLDSLLAALPADSSLSGIAVSAGTASGDP